jgi:hypothetical protein
LGAIRTLPRPSAYQQVRRRPHAAAMRPRLVWRCGGLPTNTSCHALHQLQNFGQWLWVLWRVLPPYPITGSPLTFFVMIPVLASVHSRKSINLSALRTYNALLNTKCPLNFLPDHNQARAGLRKRAIVSTTLSQSIVPLQVWSKLSSPPNSCHYPVPDIKDNKFVQASEPCRQTKGRAL